MFLLSSCSTGFTTQKEILAPDFQLKTLDGQTVSFSHSSGKPVLLNFWASWCRPCREEMPYLQQIYDGWKDRGLIFYTINIGESPETINRFFLDNNLSMPVLLDSDRSVSQAYRITGIPETFLIDKDGIIRKRQIGAYPNADLIEHDLRLIMR